MVPRSRRYPLVQFPVQFGTNFGRFVVPREADFIPLFGPPGGALARPPYAAFCHILPVSFGRGKALRVACAGHAARAGRSAEIKEHLNGNLGHETYPSICAGAPWLAATLLYGSRGCDCSSACDCA
jgi:hypothetical protein